MFLGNFGSSVSQRPQLAVTYNLRIELGSANSSAIRRPPTVTSAWRVFARHTSDDNNPISQLNVITLTRCDCLYPQQQNRQAGRDLWPTGETRAIRQTAR